MHPVSTYVYNDFIHVYIALIYVCTYIHTRCTYPVSDCVHIRMYYYVDEGSGNGGNVGIVAGGVAGGLVIFFSFFIVLYIFCIRKREKGTYVCTYFTIIILLLLYICTYVIC